MRSLAHVELPVEEGAALADTKGMGSNKFTYVRLAVLLRGLVHDVAMVHAGGLQVER